MNYFSEALRDTITFKWYRSKVIAGGTPLLLLQMRVTITSSNEKIPLELKLFNLKDGLHLNMKHGCKALAGTILKSLYAKLRPEACKTGGRKSSKNKARRKHLTTVCFLEFGRVSSQ